MLLNMHIIRDYLSWKLNGDLKSDRVKRRLRAPALAQDGRLEKGCVYVLEPWELAGIHTIDPEAGLIFTGPPPAEPQLEQVEYLYSETALEKAALFNDLWRVFARFQHWELELETQMSGPDPAQGLADCGVAYLRNPIGVYTSSFYILSCSEQKNDVRKSFYLPNEKGNFIGEEEVNSLLTMEEFVQTWSTEGPMLFWGNHDSENQDSCCLYQNIIINGKIPARVVINNYDSPIIDSDYPILDFFCGYITRALRESQTFSTNLHPPYFDQLLLALANGQPCNQEQLHRAMRQMGWQSEHEYFCGYIYSQQDDAIGSIANACSRLEDYVPGSCAVQQDNHILLVVNLCRAGKSREEILSKIVYHLREYLLKAGFSNTFTGINNLYEYDRQARVALNFGMKKDSTFWVYRFENYVLQFLLEHATQDLTPESLCHPGLLRLLDSDRKKNRDYAGTLRVYLENNMNVAQTIRQIYIQRATFQYQLQRITEIMGANLQDYETRLHLLLSFRLLDLKKQSTELESNPD